MTTPSRTTIAMTIAIATWATTAHAGVDRIVIEAYGSGSRPSDASTILAPAYAELAKRGYTNGAPLVTAVARSISRDGGVLSASQVVEAQRDIDDSYQRFVDGEYKRALAGARAALQLYSTAFGQLAREPALRDLRYKALIIAARSAEVTGAGEDAFGLMAEAIRSFPDRAISAAQFDPSVSALYRRVKAELALQGAGSLEIKVDDAAANIFVDEQFAAAGAAKFDRLAPGRYRVLVTKGRDPGRVREIDVGPAASASLAVSWQVDGTLRSGQDFVALDLDPSAGSDGEIAAAIRVGRALGAENVVVLSVRPVNGRRAIVGYSISVGSQTKTFAAVQIEPIPPSSQKIASLAALLAGDKTASATGLITTEPIELSAEGDDSASRGRGGARRPMSLIIGGIAIASLIGAAGFELSSRGTYDESKNEGDDARQRTLYESANRKYQLAQGLAIGGLVLATGAAILWFSGGQAIEKERGVAVAPVPTPDGFSLAVSGRF